MVLRTGRYPSLCAVSPVHHHRSVCPGHRLCRTHPSDRFALFARRQAGRLSRPLTGRQSGQKSPVICSRVNGHCSGNVVSGKWVSMLASFRARRYSSVMSVESCGFKLGLSFNNTSISSRPLLILLCQLVPRRCG